MGLGLIAVGLLLYSGNDKNADQPGPYMVSHHWNPGTQQSYNLSIISDVGLVLPGNALPQQFNQQVTGTLNLRVFDWEPEGQIRVGFQLYPVAYTLNGQVDEAFQQGLALPFVAMFDQSGSPHAFQFPEAVKKMERTILKEAIRTFQLVFPTESKNSWTVAEENATGRYLAHYQVQKDGSIHKKKALYTEVNLSTDNDDAAIQAKVKLGKSSAVIRLSPEMAWIHDAKIIEKLSVSDGSGLSSTMVMSGDLELLTYSINSLELPLFGALSWQELLRSDTGEAPESVLSADMAGTSGGPSSELLEERLAGLVADVSAGGEEGRITRLKRIEALLVAHPDLAYSLLEYLQQPGDISGLDAWLIHILERAGTPQAQEALVMVADDSFYRNWNRIRAIIALGGVENATDEAIAFLVTISQSRQDDEANDRANAALMAVGAIGKTLSASAPERSDRIRDNLTANLNAARDSTETGMVLKAMENLGDPALERTITPYLQDESPYVRGAAALALGRTRSEGTLDVLTDHLALEQDRQVRSAIITGMEGVGNATVRSLNVVQEMVLQEPDSGTRYHMTRYLGNNLDRYPEGRDTLKSLVIRDKSSQVRKTASVALYKSETS